MAIRRIHDNGIKVCRFVRRPVSVQCVAVTQVLIGARYAVQHHVHARQVVSLILQFLAKEMNGTLVVDAFGIIVIDADLQKQRSGPHGRVIHSKTVLRVLSGRNNTSNDLRDRLRGIELTSFLAGFRCKLSDQVLVGIAQGIFWVIVKVNMSKCFDDRRDHLVTLVRRFAQVLRINVEILKEPFVSTAAGSLDVAKRLTQFREHEGAGIDLVVERCECALGMNHATKTIIELQTQIFPRAVRQGFGVGNLSGVKTLRFLVIEQVIGFNEHFVGQGLIEDQTKEVVFVDVSRHDSTHFICGSPKGGI